MSPVSLGLDGLLILLLGCAMAIGLRLNAKLKDLKDSQIGFVKAVGELDRAAIRAESGLEALRLATIDAHDQLLTRIETARGLSARLDRVLPEAETAAVAAEAAAESARSAADMARRAAVRAAAPPAPVARPVEREEAVVITLPTAFNLDRDRSAEVFEEPSPEERPGERAAALFLEERARRATAIEIEAEPIHDVAAGSVSRLARFKARRAGGRA